MTQASAEGYVEDTAEATAFEQLGEWWNYNPINHTVSPKLRTFVLRFTDGSDVKVAVRDDDDDAGTTGLVTFDWASIPGPPRPLPELDLGRGEHYNIDAIFSSKSGGRPTMMLALFSVLVFSTPWSSYEAALSAARKFVAAHDYAHAAEAYAGALALKPNDAVAMSGQGYAHMLAGKTDDARSEFQTALGWAKTPREKKMLEHNLALLDKRATRCNITVSRDRALGQTFASLDAALAARLEPGLWDWMKREPHTLKDVCPDCTTAPTGAVIGTGDFSWEAYVMRIDKGGKVVMSPRLGAGMGGRCGAPPFVEIVSQEPLVVRVSEETQDLREDDDPEGGMSSCWITNLDGHDLVLDPVTLDVVLEVTRAMEAPMGVLDRDQIGTGTFANGAITVTACGKHQTVPLAAPAWHP